jgi:hypothetical protein
MKALDELSPNLTTKSDLVDFGGGVSSGLQGLGGPNSQNPNHIAPGYVTQNFSPLRQVWQIWRLEGRPSQTVALNTQNLSVCLFVCLSERFLGNGSADRAKILRTDSRGYSLGIKFFVSPFDQISIRYWSIFITQWKHIEWYIKWKRSKSWTQILEQNRVSIKWLVIIDQILIDFQYSVKTPQAIHQMKALDELSVIMATELCLRQVINDYRSDIDRFPILSGNTSSDTSNESARWPEPKSCNKIGYPVSD